MSRLALSVLSVHDSSNSLLLLDLALLSGLGRAAESFQADRTVLGAIHGSDSVALAELGKMVDIALDVGVEANRVLVTVPAISGGAGGGRHCFDSGGEADRFDGAPSLGNRSFSSGSALDLAARSLAADLCVVKVVHRDEHRLG